MKSDTFTETVERTQLVTAKQVTAVKNMLAGVLKWKRD